MADWSLGQWIEGVVSSQKIFGLYCVECHKGEKIVRSVGFGLCG